MEISISSVDRHPLSLSLGKKKRGSFGGRGRRQMQILTDPNELETGKTANGLCVKARQKFPAILTPYDACSFQRRCSLNGIAACRNNGAH